MCFISVVFYFAWNNFTKRINCCELKIPAPRFIFLGRKIFRKTPKSK